VKTKGKNASLLLFSLVLKWCSSLHYKLQGKRTSYVRIKGLIHGKWWQCLKISWIVHVVCLEVSWIIGNSERTYKIYLGLGDSTYYFVRTLKRRGFQVHLWEPWEELCLWTISFWSYVQLILWENLVEMGWLYKVNVLFVNNNMTNWL
jgi:hypothetical protein